MSGEEERRHSIRLSTREARLAQWVLEGFQHVPDAGSDLSRTSMDVLIDRLERHRKGSGPSETFALNDEEVQIAWMAVEAIRRDIEEEGVTPPQVRRPAVLFDLADRIKRLLDKPD
jgi:hypothetical protein